MILHTYRTTPSRQRHVCTEFRASDHATWNQPATFHPPPNPLHALDSPTQQPPWKRDNAQPASGILRPTENPAAEKDPEVFKPANRRFHFDYSVLSAGSYDRGRRCTRAQRQATSPCEDRQPFWDFSNKPLKQPKKLTCNVTCK
ncbi:hypothetical protein BDU57DRAFT_508533 [Ampelomyces quisqualis]|uniref:Uncharacterized protein n=1 Tax=Ampelomyces quisqualis TaxID=50730 RepID=A0A6A5R0E6_AMPQU|nr:hypothetical protein BDU57DRAFT_508533 [Ampelomyces quisqualis]